MARGDGGGDWPGPLLRRPFRRVLRASGSFRRARRRSARRLASASRACRGSRASEPRQGEEVRRARRHAPLPARRLPAPRDVRGLERARDGRRARDLAGREGDGRGAEPPKSDDELPQVSARSAPPSSRRLRKRWSTSQTVPREQGLGGVGARRKWIAAASTGAASRGASTRVERRRGLERGRVLGRRGRWPGWGRRPRAGAGADRAVVPDGRSEAADGDDVRLLRETNRPSRQSDPCGRAAVDGPQSENDDSSATLETNQPSRPSDAAGPGASGAKERGRHERLRSEAGPEEDDVRLPQTQPGDATELRPKTARARSIWCRNFHVRATHCRA